MAHVSNDLRALAAALGGEVTSGAVSCPGPDHSPKDRSLRVYVDWQAPAGVRVHSHAGDDWRVCMDHVLRKLGREPVDKLRQPQKRPSRSIEPKDGDAKR